MLVRQRLHSLFHWDAIRKQGGEHWEWRDQVRISVSESGVALLPLPSVPFHPNATERITKKVVDDPMAPHKWHRSGEDFSHFCRKLGAFEGAVGA